MPMPSHIAGIMKAILSMLEFGAVFAVSVNTVKGNLVPESPM